MLDFGWKKIRFYVVVLKIIWKESYKIGDLFYKIWFVILDFFRNRLGFWRVKLLKKVFMESMFLVYLK